MSLRRLELTLLAAIGLTATLYDVNFGATHPPLLLMSGAAVWPTMAARLALVMIQQLSVPGPFPSNEWRHGCCRVSGFVMVRREGERQMAQGFRAAVPCPGGFTDVRISSAQLPIVDGSPVSLGGCTFGPVPGAVYLCDGTSYAGSVTCVPQAVTSWQNTIIEYTLSLGALATTTPLYLYVQTP